MQPEPTETSTEYSNISTQDHSANIYQYGFQPLNLQPHGFLSEQQRGSTAFSSLSDANNVSTDLDHVTQEPFSGLDVDFVNEALTKPTVYRVFEHENAPTSLPQKCRAQGPYFKIIKSGTNLNGPKLENFPNGSCAPDID